LSHFIYYYAKCRHAECRYAERRSAILKSRTAMSKFNQTGQNLDHVFNSKIDSVVEMYLFCYEAKVPNLELKT
jgi:hypothetical protein